MDNKITVINIYFSYEV